LKVPGFKPFPLKHQSWFLIVSFKCNLRRYAEEPNRCLSAEKTIALLPTTCRHCARATTRGALASHEKACASAPDVTCAGHAEGCTWWGGGAR
jgi:hypothetical protein